MTEFTGLDQLRQGYESTAVLTAIQQQLRPELPEELSIWLGQLALLYGVPFENLVPDVRMLPPESIRFFYVDTNWLEALVDGAFSIGVHSNRDIRYHKVMQHVIREATDVAAGKLRKDMRGEVADLEKTGGLITDGRVRAGFLMRSDIVAGWPGLEVTGYRIAEENADDKLELLRLERLSPDVLLCIFSEIPRLVVLNEPAEDFHFGVTGSTIWLRNPEEGQRLSNDNDIPIPWRNEEDRVLNILQLQRDIGTALNSDFPDIEFGPANIAVQMVDAPDKQIFDPEIAAAEEGNP